jgi:hypothetical protein
MASYHGVPLAISLLLFLPVRRDSLFGLRFPDRFSDTSQYDLSQLKRELAEDDSQFVVLERPILQ